MRIFPKNDYLIELSNDSIFAISELKKVTLSKEQFVVNYNNQRFIGEIKEDEFEVKLSKQFVGEFCILNGKLKNERGVLEIRIGKIIKIIFIAISLFSFSGIIMSIIQNRLELIFRLLLSIFAFRFIFLELGFRFVSKSAIKKLKKTIGIKKINNIP